MEEETYICKSPVYIVSCGEGINGEQIAQSALVQFKDNRMPVKKVPHIREINQIEGIIKKAVQSSGIIVHSIVDSEIRNELIEQGKMQGIKTIDIMGQLLNTLSEKQNKKPLSQPGLYRQHNKVDMFQVRAIEYSIAHDDGIGSDKLGDAEIVIVGVSRAGKTPLSMYLSVLGWKVANIPLIPGVPLPEEIYKIDKRRVIALTINSKQLLEHRTIRQKRLGKSFISGYSSKDRIMKEVKQARDIYRKAGFSVIDVSSKPIETSADEIIDKISRRFKEKSHKRINEAVS